jgi:crossover junction endodeoxyribonuclease RuvC
MKVLGIDPGSNITGYGLIENGPRGLTGKAFGEIRSPRGGTFSGRLLKIHREMSELIDSHEPDAVAMEEIFFGKNVQSLIKQGHARGVAILAAVQRGIPIFEYSPTQIKLAVVGYGLAGKGQVQSMVKLILGLSETPSLDASDALAIAICHSNFLKKTEA